MALSISLAQMVGFYYLIIEPRNTRYARCWLDGDDDFRIFSKEDLMEMADKKGDNPRIKAMLENIFSESSIFLGDVEGENISQLYASRIEEEPEPRKFHPMETPGISSIKDPVEMSRSGAITIDRDISFLGLQPLPLDKWK